MFCVKVQTVNLIWPKEILLLMGISVYIKHQFESSKF